MAHVLPSSTHNTLPTRSLLSMSTIAVPSTIEVGSRGIVDQRRETVADSDCVRIGVGVTVALRATVAAVVPAGERVTVTVGHGRTVDVVDGVTVAVGDSVTVVVSDTVADAGGDAVAVAVEDQVTDILIDVDTVMVGKGVGVTVVV